MEGRQSSSENPVFFVLLGLSDFARENGVGGVKILLLHLLVQLVSKQ